MKIQSAFLLPLTFQVFFNRLITPHVNFDISLRTMGTVIVPILWQAILLNHPQNFIISIQFLAILLAIIHVTENRQSYIDAMEKSTLNEAISTVLGLLEAAAKKK